MIHKEGIKLLGGTLIILVILNACIFIFIPSLSVVLKIIIPFASLIIVLFICLFFRKPHPNFTTDQKRILSPADGTVISVEPVFEDEFFNDRKNRVSIFMSIWNVHINWYAVSGKVIYYKYHPGKYFIARYPKSSVLNERNTVVIDNPVTGEIMIRQIAGAVARRIVSYVTEQKEVSLGEELGFIRFGSRVDLFLPVDIQILVKPGDSVRGLRTTIAQVI
jgi:phosphatidylserine decarboxylase